jgi:hypothetical protein
MARMQYTRCAVLKAYSGTHQAAHSYVYRVRAREWSLGVCSVHPGCGISGVLLAFPNGHAWGTHAVRPRRGPWSLLMYVTKQAIPVCCGASA